MRQSLLAALIALSAASTMAGAAPSPISGQFRSGDLPNFDANAVAQAAALAADGGAARRAVEGSTSRFGLRGHYDDRLGSTFLWAGKNERLPANALAADLTGRGLLEARGRQFLGLHATALGLTPRAIAEAKLFDAQDLGEGPLISRFRQHVGGIEVFARDLNVVTDRTGRLVAISGYFVPGVDGTTLRTAGYRLAAPRAIAAAFQDLGGEAGDALALAREENGYQVYKRGTGQGDLQLDGDPRVKKVYFGLGASLVPAYYVEVSAASRDGGRQANYGYVISAVDGSVLFRKNQVDHVAFSYRAFADPDAVGHPYDEPLGNLYAPFPKADPTAKLPRKVVKSKLVSISSSALLSTADPWLAATATVTTGNNVDAYLDLAAPNGFSGTTDIRPKTTSARAFEYAVKGDTDPTTAVQRNGAAVNLFYMNNFLHDFWYDRGFNEAAGNAQSNNFGRGGVGNDPILAEGQDYSGRNNANMSTPSDGGSPRMQMYLFDGLLNGEFTITDPASIAGGKEFAPAAFGATSWDLTNKVVTYQDNTAPTGDACTAAVNPTALVGKIALIDRGNCDFVVKVKNAQTAGAIAAVVADNVSESPITMGGTDATITIPAVLITLEDGAAIKGAGVPVTAHMRKDAVDDLDGTIDEMVISHEFFHHVSNRLVGNANGLFNNQGGGMGEGWSDFSSMLIQVRPEDLKVPTNANFSGAYPVGTYVSGDYYFGIRRTPYSTDMLKDPLTFKHIQNGVALPAGVPISFGQDGASNAEVHNTGEVWCNVLWEAYAGFLNDGRYTFDQARGRVQSYVIAGLKMTPVSPTLLEARDGILAAADATNDKDFTIWATAFAKRGMGANAIAPPRNSTTNIGVTESFVIAQPTP